MSIVEVLKIKKGNFELNLSQWEIPDQGVHVLWGSSGSGKTTVLRSLLGLDSPKEFIWKFLGLDLAKLKAPERRLGVVFQTLDLFHHMTAEENILFAAKARGLKDQEAQEVLADWSKKLGMESFLKTKTSNISGGEAQRVALLRALIGRPRMLLLDEPFSQLDPDLRKESRGILKKFISEMSIPTLLITHDLDDVKDLATSQSTIKNGRII